MLNQFLKITLLYSDLIWAFQLDVDKSLAVLRVMKHCQTVLQPNI